ncbi:MAG: hypothetical protein ABIM40_12120, partial [Pseudomonadota bacterium]
RGPLISLEDFRTSRFAAWYGSLDRVLYEALEVQHTPLNVPGTVEAFRDGTCDATLGPALFILGSGLQGITKYVSPVPVRYSPASQVLTNAAWDSLALEHRECLLAEREAIQQAFCLASRRDTEDCLSALRSYGVSQEPMDPETELALRVRLKRSWDDLAGDVYPRELLDRILAHLENFRARKAETP